MITLHDKEFVPYLDAACIAERVTELAAVMTAEYQGKNPLFIAVLNGAFIFAADLFRRIPIDAEIAFVRLSSYEGMRSGAIHESLGMPENINGRHLIVLEDILDSGKTLSFLLKRLQQEAPASLKVAVLLHKPTSLQYPVAVDYFGFEIPDRFVVGYGLDYDGLGRNLPDIYQLKQ